MQRHAVDGWSDF